jgi:hypothetical protein
MSSASQTVAEARAPISRSMLYRSAERAAEGGYLLVCHGGLQDGRRLSAMESACHVHYGD